MAIYGFCTEDLMSAKAAMLVYAIYRSRDKRRGPSGTDMWGQIERFARASAKRAMTVGDFVGTFKRRMACDSISPRWMETGELRANGFGEIVVRGDQRNFMPEIMEADDEQQREIVDRLYRQTTKIILLVRARLEAEKPIESQIEKAVQDGE